MGPRRSVLLLSVLLCALALCCAAPALALEPAGDGWYWQAPQPQGQVLNAVAFGDTTNLWAVGDAGTIMHSADAGVTWQVQTSPTKASLGSVQFVNATEGWAAGGDSRDAGGMGKSSNGVILHTTDGGAIWTVQASEKDAAVTDLAFVGDKQGWAVGGRGVILHTTDGGQAWARQKSGVTRNILCVAFADAEHGYAGCTEGVILTTADGGATWKRSASQVDFTAASLAIGSDGKLWAGLGGRDVFGYFPRLAWSANGGRTWRYPDVSRTQAIWDVVADGANVYAVGPSQSSGDGGVSQILVSSDGGTTWKKNVTGSASLGAIATNAAGTLCAVGDMVATSTDDGATWYGHSTRSPLIGAVDMVGPTEAWAVSGLAGTGVLDSLLGMPETAILHTTDGARWERSFSPGDRSFSGLDFADPSHGWAVGSRGLIGHTADGGLTWQVQSSGTTAPLALVSAPSPDAAWAYGYKISRNALTPTLVRTADAGATWAPVATPAGVYPFAMTALSADRAWLVGIRRVRKTVTSVALHTTDGGTTWSRATLPFPSTGVAIPLAVDFTDADHGWLVALDVESGSSTVAATSDGGATWTIVASQAAFGSDLIASIDFIDAQEGWASGTGIFHTTDGGKTWTRQVSGSTDAGYFVSAWDAAHALATGGGVLSTFDTAGDSAAPVTLCAAAGGWTNTSVAPTLTAADVGASGLASTEYRVDGGAWTPGLAPSPFPAPSDHSGDGRHTLRYRSTDNAGNVEPVQELQARVDTIKPVVHLGRCVLGRDGVLRMRLRIDDKSCPSVNEFGFSMKSVDGHAAGGAGWDGFRLRTNRWVTFRDRHTGDYLDAGVYRIAFRTSDRAGNETARAGRGLLVVRPHKQRPWPSRTAVQALRGGGRAVYDFGAGTARATVVRRDPAPASAGARLTAELHRLVEKLTASGR